MKSAWIAIIGRPSSGKSTLLNRFCGRKVSIVAPSPQTTRNTVRGIVNGERGQLVFADTPGYHISKKKLNRYLMENAEDALEDCDLIIYLNDASRSGGTEEEAVQALLKPLEKRIISVVNKIDIPGAKPEKHLDECRRAFPGRPAIAVSAERGDKIPELLELLFDNSPEGEALYPEEFYTDQDPEFRVSELIREAAVARAKKELPHSIYVAVEDMEIQSDDESGEEKLFIRAVIYVERESQKGIVVGKGGSGMAAIGKTCRKQLKKLFDYRIHLDLRVKCDPKWRSRDPLLRKLLDR